MKRSEIIEVLHNYTTTLRIPNGDQTVDQEIVRILEEAGMTPPAIKVPCPTYFQDAMGQVRQGEDSWTYVNKWEEE